MIKSHQGVKCIRGKGPGGDGRRKMDKRKMEGRRWRIGTGQEKDSQEKRDGRRETGWEEMESKRGTEGEEMDGRG